MNGKETMKLKVPAYNSPLILKNVLYSSSLGCNLLAGPNIVKDDYYFFEK